MIRDRKLRNATARARKSQRGAVYVEMAFVFTLFFTLLMGTFDFSQFLFMHQMLTERARWAIRSGVAQQATNDQIRNLMIYGNTGGTGTAYYGLTTSNVTVATSGLTTDDARTMITVSGYPYKMFTPFAAGDYTGAQIVVDVPRGMFD